VQWDGLALFNKTTPVYISEMQRDTVTPDKFIFEVSSILIEKKYVSGRLETHW
jgi:hypothetical protein